MPTDDIPSLERLQAMTARLAPVAMKVDLGELPDSERRALDGLVRAARVIDGLFLRQVWAGNPALLAELAADATPLGRARLQQFLLDKGPWSRLDEDAPFVPDVPPKPAGANYYPADATREEVASWMDGLDGEARRAARGFFTTIRRDPDGALRAVPYRVEYQDALALAAGHLRDAAAATGEPTLAAYLRSRAEALLTDDYVASDVAWMELESALEPTLGPYEVYEDGWFNAKAAFEAFITVRDAAETARLEHVGRHLQELEDHLPIAATHRNPRLGALAPIRVVNEVLATGDANRGVRTAAFILPNDERVLREKGAKRVMLRNVQRAKFERVLVPIADRVLPAEERSDVTFDAFFTHILMHELMHGLGPHDIEIAGRATTVRQELGETYSVIEEAKADASGLWALAYLVERDRIDGRLGRAMYTTFLASMFRSLRFGVTEAHGRGVAIQLNHLLDADAVRVGQDDRFAIDHARVGAAVADLTGLIMTLQAHGDRDRARDLIAGASVRPEVARALARLHDVPVDIRPVVTS